MCCSSPEGMKYGKADGVKDWVRYTEVTQQHDEESAPQYHSTEYPINTHFNSTPLIINV